MRTLCECGRSHGVSERTHGIGDLRGKSEGLSLSLQAPGPRRLGKRLVGFRGLGPGGLYLLEGLLQLCLLNPVPPLFSVTRVTVARDRRHAGGGEILFVTR